jgi:glycyl-tRNA synthetase beta chain
VIGRYYALASGEPAEVAEAIREHYLPRFAGDALPVTPAGTAIALADKMDTIAGSFGIGNRPTGSEDPYGLRRLTLGIIAIILDGELSVDLGDLLEAGLAGLGGRLERPTGEVRSELEDFFRGRLTSLFTGDGFRPDLVEAVLATGMNDLPDARRRLRALSEFRTRDEFEPLATAFRRVVNIIPPGFSGEVKENLLTEPAEKELHSLYRERAAGLTALREGHRYGELLSGLASLRPAVDRFFDEIMVMVDDLPLRHNRLALMRKLADLFDAVADFGRIATP